MDSGLTLFLIFFCSSSGYETALVEKFDFASGTSSRSTKLIHGGVRYLQKAIFNLDLEQVKNLYVLIELIDLSEGTDLCAVDCQM